MQALRAGAADRARLRGKVDGRSEELGSGEYWPIVKIMWEAVTRTAQSILICPSLAD